MVWPQPRYNEDLRNHEHDGCRERARANIGPSTKETTSSTSNIKLYLRHQESKLETQSPCDGQRDGRGGG
ncbi:uncharacterized protein A1O9_08524 [Exophiala aquamarina CBS 119918]|uniref:Uncharacterized protein n=1 Tax=Exophiala aquamarina CBS 119918 TaxID=1182545 RepID=A0A072P948_9EURO|nr:uncharacterized protein A1O9_08524 [Exophiala aquamarina CBS 119918]KEF55773.1 hypothetical protein A1O9_08524 [Exophiala aquamarina CBS 119918]